MSRSPWWVRRINLGMQWLVTQAIGGVSTTLRDVGQGWNRFWFTPRSPRWLGVMRILAGLMLLYTHAVWTLDFEAFLGVQRMIPDQIAEQMNPSPWHWTHFDWVGDWRGLWALHGLALLSFVAFTVGWGMPWSGVLATLFAISYAHRASGALFGLDQMNVALATYLTLGGAGRAYSLDGWWAARRAARGGDASVGGLWGGGGVSGGEDTHCVWANLATRLIQVQLCIIYWFAGTGKLQGVSWWNGEAIWGAFASYQYQSIDMSWTYQFPLWLALATHMTVIWEISYPFLVWNGRTRPWVIGIAFLVHGGIGLFLGMMTFGYIMVVANLAFVEWSGMFGRAPGRDESRGQQ